MNNCDILLFVNDLNFYRSHRSKLFKFLSLTKNITVVTENTLNINKNSLENANLKIDLINFNRTSLNPFKNLFYLYSLLNKVKMYSPNKVIFVSNKLIFLGALINLFKSKGGTKYFFFFSGLGYLFISNSLFARSMKWLLLTFIKLSSRRGNVEIVVQNNDDLSFFRRKLNLSYSPIHLIKGNGIKPQKVFNKTMDSINILFAGRLLKDKGIFEYLDAAKFIKEYYPEKKINFLRWNIDLWDKYEIYFDQDHFSITDPLKKSVSFKNNLKILWRKPFTDLMNFESLKDTPDKKSDSNYAKSEMKAITHSIMALERENF